MKPLVVGLTGGVGSGKSTVASRFARRDVTTINADALAREVVAPGSPALTAIRSHFGEAALTSAGELDRAWLRQRVFTHAQDRLWLEDLLHPLIAERRDHLIAAAQTPYVLVEIPLLLEKQLQGEVDRVLVIDLPEALQLERGSARDGANQQTIAAIMQAQVSREERLQQADDVIDNSGDLKHLDAQVEKLHQNYLLLASSRRT